MQVLPSAEMQRIPKPQTNRTAKQMYLKPTCHLTVDKDKLYSVRGYYPHMKRKVTTTAVGLQSWFWVFACVVFMGKVHVGHFAHTISYTHTH